MWLLLACIVVGVVLLAKAWLSSRAQFEAMRQAVIAGNLPEVRRIIARHPQLVNAVDTGDIMIHDSMLHGAVNNRRYSVAKLLLDNGASVDALDFGGATPLILAASNEDAKMVQLLLGYHPRLDVRDNIGMTALNWAAHADDPRMAKTLLEAGADPRVANKHGKTPLQTAVKNGKHATAEAIQRFTGSKRARQR
jgi:hypothetical protein